MTETPTAGGSAAAHSRDALRQAYCDAWRKQQAGSPMTPLEAMLADIVALHPEYQAMLQDAAAARGFESDAAGEAENPFLHMGLHTAVREQVAIDRPPGVRDLHRRLKIRCGTVHGAEHVLMEALAETLWDGQRAGRAPDEARYLDRARSRLALI